MWLRQNPFYKDFVTVYKGFRRVKTNPWEFGELEQVEVGSRSGFRRRRSDAFGFRGVRARGPGFVAVGDFGHRANGFGACLRLLCLACRVWNPEP